MRPPPTSTRTATPFPYTSLFLSRHRRARASPRGWNARSGLEPQVWSRSSRACLRAPWTVCQHRLRLVRSEEHTSELQSLMRISYAVFCLKKKNDDKVTLLLARRDKIRE